MELVIYYYMLCGTLDFYIFTGKGGSGVERTEIEITRKYLASTRSVLIQNSQRKLSESTSLAFEGFFSQFLLSISYLASFVQL